MSEQVREFRPEFCGEECLTLRERVLFAACEACISLSGKVSCGKVEMLMQEFESHDQAPLSAQSRAATVTGEVDALMKPLFVFCPELHGHASSDEHLARLPSSSAWADEQGGSTCWAVDSVSLSMHPGPLFFATPAVQSLDTRVDEAESSGSLTPAGSSTREGPSILFRSLSNFRDDDAAIYGLPGILSPAPSSWYCETRSPTPVEASSTPDWQVQALRMEMENSTRRCRSHSPLARSRKEPLKAPYRVRQRAASDSAARLRWDRYPPSHGGWQPRPGQTPRSMCSVSTVSSRCSSASDTGGPVEDCFSELDLHDDEILRLMAELKLISTQARLLEVPTSRNESSSPSWPTGTDCRSGLPLPQATGDCQRT